jgi:hypothetical protein
MGNQPTPDLYRGIVDGVQGFLSKFFDAKNMLNLFPHRTVDNVTLKKLIFRHFNDVAEASLSAKLWDPAKTEMFAETYSHNRYSTGLESNLGYEDWKILDQMDNIMDLAQSAISEKPLKQGTHYYWTGKKLKNDGNRANPPNQNQYNFVQDAGTSSGTLKRPLIVTQASQGAWGTTDNMLDDALNLVTQMVETGFDDKSDFMFFYPNTLESAIMKKRTTSGDGRYSFAQEVADHGIPNTRHFTTSFEYLPEADAGADPTTSDFDVYVIKRSMVRIYYTMEPFVNVYVENTGTRFPNMKIETGMAYCPVFIPLENRSDDKFYKGVGRITGCSI